MDDCIFGSDLGSLTEGVYLGIPITDNQRNFNIAVNPSRITYLINKTVIINRFDYPVENINPLLKNRNKIISRIWFGDDIMENILFDPYLPRLNMNIIWNGDILNELGEKNEDIQEKAHYSTETNTLFFPKVKKYLDNPGEKGELNFIGYLLYQVGLNLFKCDFNNLDIVKCKKGIF